MIYKTSSSQEICPIEIIVSKEDETLEILFEKNLSIEKGKLVIHYSGMLNGELKGFYKYKNHNGNFSATTYFEARK